MNFGFVPKSQRKSILCSREILLKRPQIVTQTFAQTFVESSREQRTKFAHFASVTFSQYCNDGMSKDNFHFDVPYIVKTPIHVSSCRYTREKLIWENNYIVRNAVGT